MISTKELARRWQISEQCLRRWRLSGKGPAFVRIGGTVRYREEDILAYEASNAEQPKEQETP